MPLTSKKAVRPTTRSSNEDPDPVGFGTTLAEIIAELQDAYRARLHAFLLKSLLVRLDAAERRSIFAAVTARGRPSTSTSESPSIPLMPPVSFVRTAH